MCSYYTGNSVQEETRQQYATRHIQRIQREGTAPGFAVKHFGLLLELFREAGRDYDRGMRSHI